jgi:hypothetical protein
MDDLGGKCIHGIIKKHSELLIGPEGKRLLGMAEIIWQDNIKKFLIEIESTDPTRFL